MIHVVIEEPQAAALDGYWASLAPFAVNAFMSLAALRTAAACGTEVRVLVAFAGEGAGERVVGWWALGTRRLLAWRYVVAPPYEYAFLATPVLDPAYAAPAVAAMLAALRDAPGLPGVLRIKDIEVAEAGFAAIAGFGGVVRELERDERPVAGRAGGLKRSGSTRRKLRQDWNRLGGVGALRIVNHRGLPDVAAALEHFLALELAGWKGARGTALLARDADARFARRFIGDMAAAGTASVALLELDGRPIAAQVLLYQGRQAFTWKTGYDPAFARYSPGALLVDGISTELIDSGAVETIDSCSVGGGFMSGLWSARKPVADLVLSLRSGPSVPYLVVSGAFAGRKVARAARDRLRGGWPFRKARAPSS